MSRELMLALAALLVCARAYEEKQEVVASESGRAILRCLFDSAKLHSDPPPTITWKLGELKIDGNAGRYRLMSDGALEIVSLYRNDTGVYICVADNGLGVVTQEVHLVVNGPVTMPAGIAGDENAMVIGELGQPLDVRCLAYGYPPPAVFWNRDNEQGMALYPFTEDIKEVTVNELHIESLTIDTLGPYTCLAFNTVGKVATWRVVMKAYRPEGLFIENEWLVPRDTMASRPRTQPLITTDIWLFTESSIMPEFTEIKKETTGSFDTSKSSTTNEETTYVIGTSTLDPCSGFQFGCCADNETEAIGPDGQGCPCNATEFGCCPDGVSPALGLDNESCPGPCSKTPHGCCQDEKTPAHGPEFEGCCLLQTFGCCPDNRKPAEGPYFEGCGCQYALHGCCPDNVTIAQGPDNLGCGCQYTQHGCCPDRHTAALGTNNEGCACGTYQFGCCDDGVTIATGPDKLGCHCRESKFGCCGDGETHATGPDAAGCDCSSSQHGCCPDGRTEAAGPKFLGCTDAPENKQAVCSMSTDPGPCHNFTAMWYYDLAYGSCSRFWYGGCDGNGNRFSIKEECEDVCVQPSPKDACKLPSVKGACDANYQRWHYNSTWELCIPFRYGGCLGNANNFDNRELCQKQCEPSSIADQCKLPIDQGSCAGNYSRWGFNSEAHRCEQFIWGGCEGNSNRFSSEEACRMRCVGTQPPQCMQPQEAGNCTENEPLWSFSQSENRCLPFYYSGCGGNDNRFGSREACEQTCPSAYVPDKCTLPAETGQCSNYRERWFYDTTYKRCRQFYYGGCVGNENNFATEVECDNSCSEIKTTTTTTTTSTAKARPVEPQTQSPHRPEQEPRPTPDSIEVLPRDCTPYQQECEVLDCQYGVDRFAQDDCQRCICRENPCIRVNCSLGERCETVVRRNPASQEPEYSAKCVIDNEVYHCDEYMANCSRLHCEYGIQRARLRNGCERCICKEYPCEKISCAAGERCVVDRYVNGLVETEPQFTAECRTIVKAGACPMDETTTNEVTCRHECADDAECRVVGKCCRRGCSDICVLPVEQTSPHPFLTTTIAPNVPAAPQALPPPEPEVQVSEGGKATLRCLFHSNPLPKITWRFGELTIDGNVNRYRLKSDGVLEIVSLYHNDTGVYICVADNGLGVATQEVHLVVNDPVRMPVGIAGDKNAVVTGELGQPLHVRCLAYGYPPPSVFWYRGYNGTMVPYNDRFYEARGNVLLIRSLAIDTLGEYTCQAYNGEGKAASWVVFVRAYKPEGLFIEHEFLVPRNTLAPSIRTQPPTTAETTTTTTSTTTEVPRPLFTVPVSTHVSTPFSTLNIGADLHLTCDVDGFPEPDVHWTKDGVNIQADGRITITGSAIVSRLTVMQVSVADSGQYACHASNPYSSQSDTAQINVQQLMIPAKCTDNPFFANCGLIVRSKFCRYNYYGKFCCKSCVEAGQLDPQEAALQADQPLKKK